MAFSIKGLHHVTATVNTADEDLNFYVRMLGLRLVKVTVNFDNPGVYHFYYGNGQGSPGTIMTTFPYQHMGTRHGQNGRGMITLTSFSVPADAIGYWRDRLAASGIRPTEKQRFGQAVLQFPDPAGLMLELAGSDADERLPWEGGTVPAEAAIRGINTVSMLVERLEPTARFLTEVFGMQVTGTEGATTRFAVSGAEKPGYWVDVREDAQAPAGLNGLGTVHHVAFRISSDEEQRRLGEFLKENGVNVTEQKDRKYFRSIYFRSPGGILFEAATDDPGFAVDEPAGQLGTTLRLPDWMEPERKKIGSMLPPVDFTRFT
jgi:glyoxalase family protein